MPPSPQAHPPLVTPLRWVAHVLSVLILFFFAVMIGGEAMQGQTPNLKPQEILFFAALAVQLIGLLVAFRKETPGGLMVLVGFLLQAVAPTEIRPEPVFRGPAIHGSVATLLRLARATPGAPVPRGHREARARTGSPSRSA